MVFVGIDDNVFLFTVQKAKVLNSNYFYSRVVLLLAPAHFRAPVQVSAQALVSVLTILKTELVLAQGISGIRVVFIRHPLVFFNSPPKKKKKKVEYCALTIL